MSQQVRQIRPMNQSALDSMSNKAKYGTDDPYEIDPNKKSRNILMCVATASIVVWHFYFVIFDPVVYPMDTTWLTGQSPVARFKEREGYTLEPETEEEATEEKGVAAS